VQLIRRIKLHKLIQAACMYSAIFSSTFGACPANILNTAPPAYGEHSDVVHPITLPYSPVPSYLSPEETDVKLGELKRLMNLRSFQVWDAIQLLLDLTKSEPKQHTHITIEIRAMFPQDKDHTQLNCSGESRAQQLIRGAYLVLAREHISNWVLNNIIWGFENHSIWENVRKGHHLSITPYQRLLFWDTILRNYPGMSETNLRNLKEFSARLLREYYDAVNQDEASHEEYDEEITAENPHEETDEDDVSEEEAAPPAVRVPLAPLYFGNNFKEEISFIISRIEAIIGQR
jgi:hypothetical protein